MSEHTSIGSFGIGRDDTGPIHRKDNARKITFVDGNGWKTRFPTPSYIMMSRKEERANDTNELEEVIYFGFSGGNIKVRGNKAALDLIDREDDECALHLVQVSSGANPRTDADNPTPMVYAILWVPQGEVAQAPAPNPSKPVPGQRGGRS